MNLKSRTKNTVHLVAYDKDRQQIIDEFLPISTFYDDTHPVLDEPNYRRNHGIVRLTGSVHDTKGVIVQEFEVSFNASGFCECDAAKFADGSILGDWERLHTRAASPN